MPQGVAKQMAKGSARIGFATARTAMVVAVAIGGVALCGSVFHWPAQAQPAYRGESPGFGSGQAGLITHFSPAEGRPTVVTVIDPDSRVMCVYHIGRDDGQIQLMSVRPIRWDMEMDGYNTGKLTPEDIRKGLERQP